MQYGIQADALFQRIIIILFELDEQFLFIVIVKGIYNFIGKPHESVDIENRPAGFFFQQAGSRKKRSTVFPGD
jgi:hypothetical protein